MTILKWYWEERIKRSFYLLYAGCRQKNEKKNFKKSQRALTISRELGLHDQEYYRPLIKYIFTSQKLITNQDLKLSAIVTIVRKPEKPVRMNTGMFPSNSSPRRVGGLSSSFLCSVSACASNFISFHRHRCHLCHRPSADECWRDKHLPVTLPAREENRKSSEPEIRRKWNRESKMDAAPSQDWVWSRGERRTSGREIFRIFNSIFYRRKNTNRRMSILQYSHAKPGKLTEFWKIVEQSVEYSHINHTLSRFAVYFEWLRLQPFSLQSGQKSGKLGKVR